MENNANTLSEKNVANNSSSIPEFLPNIEFISSY